MLAAQVDDARLDEGVVQYQTADGRWLGFHWSHDPHDLGVWRNGRRHDWRRHKSHLYQSSDGQPAPIFAPWGEGVLYVEADGDAFGCRVDDAGQVVFENGKPADVRARVLK